MAEDGVSIVWPSTPELKLNLNAIKKCDQFVVNIVDTASQVALYKFNSETQAWEKTDVEGALFVYSRSSHPKNAFFIMNRLNMNNIMEPITSNMEFKLQDPFLLFRNKTSGIFGIWFYAGQECVRLSQLLIRLSMEELQSIKRPSSISDLTVKEKVQEGEANGKVDIMKMFAKAQEKYDKTKLPNSESNIQEQKHSVDEQKQQFLQQNQQQIEHLQQLMRGQEQQRSKQRAYSSPAPYISGPISAGIGTSTVPNPILENGPFFQYQSSAKLKETLKSLPLATGQIPVSTRAVDDSVLESSRPVAQRKLFQGDKQQASSTSSPGVSVTPQQDSPQKSMDQAAGAVAASLMSPLAFQAPAKVALPTPSQPRQTTPKLDISPLTQDQLLQALAYLMKNDADFVKKLHEAYLKSLQERLPT